MSPTSDEDDPYRRIDERLGRRAESDPWAAVGGAQSGPVPPPPSGYEAVRETVAPATPDVSPAAPPPPAQPPPPAADPFRAPPPPPPGTGVDPFRAPPVTAGGPAHHGPQPAWPQARPANEPFATAALICGALSMTCLPLTGPVGIGLGVAALRRLRTRGGHGRGLAIAGIVTGSIGTAVMLGYLVMIIVSATGSGGA